MNYELAKELKDNGFPVDKGRWNHEHSYLCEEHGYNAPTIDCGDCKFVYLPNLEELIDACGEGFGNLAIHRQDGWGACSDGEMIVVTGKTQKEAVARLILAMIEQGYVFVNGKLEFNKK